MKRLAFALATCIGFAAFFSGCFEENVLVSGLTDTMPIGLEEICPGNATLSDEFGDDPGWIELSNRSANPVALGAYRLNGGSSDGPGWKLPDTTLQAGGRLMVFMSGRDIDSASPAKDTLDPRTGAAWSWSDIQNEPPGLSTAKGLLFAPKLNGKLDKGFAASFLLNLVDGGLGWSGASVGVNFIEQQDVSELDRFFFRATIPAGQPLLLKLCDDDKECWKKSAKVFTGTGDSLGVYEFSLADFPSNLTAISGLQFDPPANNLGEYKLTITGIRFYKSQRLAHANFQLKRKGGLLVLRDTAGQLAPDSVIYPEIPSTSSWARDPVSKKWDVIGNGTPGKPNPVRTTPSILSAPAFATAPGFQKAPFTVQVVGQAGLKIRCTIDGSAPIASSPIAANGIRLDSSAAVNCAAFDDAGQSGPVATGTFFLNDTINLPVVSVTVDPNAMFDPDTGIHSLGPNASPNYPYFGANFWRDKELPVNVELFESGTRSFNVRSGLGMFGNWSRAATKKAFTIQMREKYGQTHINWPLFPEHPSVRKFKGFGLRANGSNFETDYVRDGMMSSFSEGRNIEYQYSRHVLLYLNGKYWGIYEIREKLDPDYLDSRFGIDPSTVDEVKNNSEVQAGSATDWNDLRQTLESLQPDDSAGWAAMEKRLDFDNFMDYNALEIFSQNTDWPANNVRFWRQHTPATKWRAMLFDLDASLGSFGGGVASDSFPYFFDSTKVWDAYPNGAGSNVVLRRLAGRKPLRDRFINRFLVQLATNLAPTNTVRAMDSLMASIRSAIPRDVERWELSASNQASQEKLIRTFLEKRPDVIRTSMKKFFGLEPTVSVALSAPGGTVFVEGMQAGTSYSGPHYQNLPITIEAVGAGGRVFMGWSDGEKTARRVVVPGTDPVQLVANFQ